MPIFVEDACTGLTVQRLLRTISSELNFCSAKSAQSGLRLPVGPWAIVLGQACGAHNHPWRHAVKIQTKKLMQNHQVHTVTNYRTFALDLMQTEISVRHVSDKPTMTCSIMASNAGLMESIGNVSVVLAVGITQERHCG